MDLHAFQRDLRGTAPDRSALLQLGLTEGEADELLRSFELPLRETPTPLVIEGSLGRLFSIYDPSQIEIGMVRFPEPPRRLKGAWIVGVVEADSLILDHATGALRVEDHAAQGHVLWRCAASSDQFLGALLHASAVLGARMVEEASGDAADAIAACTAIAGGEPYGDFYRMLLSVD